MPPRKRPPSFDTPVAELWNLSATTVGWLETEGIRTHGELKQADPVELHGWMDSLDAERPAMNPGHDPARGLVETKERPDWLR